MHWKKSIRLRIKRSCASDNGINLKEKRRSRKTYLVKDENFYRLNTQLEDQGFIRSYQK